jgi:hypothetical protein
MLVSSLMIRTPSAAISTRPRMARAIDLCAIKMGSPLPLIFPSPARRARSSAVRLGPVLVREERQNEKILPHPADLA